MIGRIRTVKPEFFQHSELFDAEKETGLPLRVGFAGLWTCCDREGRFKWRPRELKIRVLPYDALDFARVLDALATRGFIVKYTAGGSEFGCIPSWKKHQVINNRESQSELPAPEQGQILQEFDACSTREPHVKDTTVTESQSCKAEGKGKEGNNTTTPQAVSRRGSRIPDNFAVTPEHRAFAKTHGLPSPDDCIAEFVDYFRAAPGQKGLKLDWNATFRNWLRKAHEYGRNGKPKLASIADVIRDNPATRALAQMESA